MRTTRVLLLILPALLTVGTHGQSIDMTTDKPCRSVERSVTYAAKMTPAVDQGTVTHDLSTIRDAQKRVREFYRQRGLDDCAADAATALAWKDLRDDQPRSKLDEDALVKLANEGFGGLRVISIPTGAAIMVDGKPWDTPTDTESWTRAGRRKITLALKGYENSEGEKTVVAAKIVKYKKKLIKKK